MAPVCKLLLRTIPKVVSPLHPVSSHLLNSKSTGIEEEARCAAFSITPHGVIEDSMDDDNDTSDPSWAPKPPMIIPYKSVFVGPRVNDPTSSNRKCEFVSHVVVKL